MSTNVSPGLRHDLALQSRIEVLFPVFATIGVIIRLALRHRYKIAIQWDDALIVISVVFTWGLWGVWHWTAVHLISDRETALQPTTPPLLQKLCTAMDIFYGVGVNVVKFAILVFYLRAFGADPNATTIRLCIWILVGAVGAFTIARTIETAYLCPPICFGDPRPYSVAAWQFAMRTINWVTEFAILLFPIPILWGMTISLKKKIGIYACFFLGILTCVASAGRLASAIKLYLGQTAINKEAASMHEVDLQEWFYTYYIPQMSHMTLWSMAELNVGIITATLPAIRSPAISFIKDGMKKFRTSRISKSLSDSSDAHGLASPVETLGGYSPMSPADSKNSSEKAKSLRIDDQGPVHVCKILW